MSSTRPLTYGIYPGFLGGKRTTQPLVKLLKAAGYKNSDVASSADVIVAHSAGCWEVPASSTPQLLLYVGPSLAEPTLANSAGASARYGLHTIKQKDLPALTRFFGLGLLYAVRQPKRNLGVIRKARSGRAEIQATNAKQTVMICNQHDRWPKSPKLKKLIEDQPWAFVSLPGAHDEIWRRPDYIMEIITHYAA